MRRLTPLLALAVALSAAGPATPSSGAEPPHRARRPTVSSAAAPEEAKSATRQPVRLTVALALDEEVPTLAFILENSSLGFLEDKGLGQNNNGIRVLRPDGSVGGDHMIVDGFGRAPLIKPGQTLRRTLDVESLVRRCGMTQAGEYRLFWWFGHFRSPEIVVSRATALPEREGARRALFEGHSFATPRHAIASFLRGIDGDGNGLAPTLRASRGNKDQEPLASAVAQHCTAASLFRVRMETAFGDDSLRGWAIEATPQVREALETAEPDFPPHFETATVELLGRRFELVRQDNHWVVTMAGLAKNGPGFLRELKRRRDALMSVAEDVDGRKFATAADALKALAVLSKYDGEGDEEANPAKD